MSKYEIGQQIPVSGIITITGITHNKNGNPVYNTDRGVDVPELLLERLEMKPLEKVQPEPKPEPMKLYCFKSFPNLVTAGKIYEVQESGKLVFDNGRESSYDWKSEIPSTWPDSLCKLASRPAKVGEYVLITADSVDGTEKGEICKAIRANLASADLMYLRTKKPTTYGHPGITPRTLAFRSEYLVLDGYKPEPEKSEPEYYNGKVVCVDSAGYYHTVGKTYTVLDGFLIDDSGMKVPYLTGPVTSVDDLNSRSACKFAVLLDE